MIKIFTYITENLRREYCLFQFFEFFQFSVHESPDKRFGQCRSKTEDFKDVSKRQILRGSILGDMKSREEPHDEHKPPNDLKFLFVVIDSILILKKVYIVLQ